MSPVSFAALPPEVTSGWMYAGPGAGSMLSAAGAWDRLAGELASAASEYESVIASLLAEQWQGPSAAAMSAAAAPYREWMTTTAEQARQAGTQARAAAAAYQAARAAVVPPPVIAANRSALQSLVAGNVMGQNSAAIAANQAAYAEMWAQDATAMQTYTQASAAAATLAPFRDPSPDTDSAGRAKQTAAVAQATAQSGAAGANSFDDFLSQINNFLQTNPLYHAANEPITTFGKLLATLGAPGYLAIASPMQMLGPVWHSFFPHIAGGAAAAATMSEVSGAGLGQTLVNAATPQLGAGASAGLGRAATIGGLSVPQSWGTPIRLAAAASPLASGAPALAGAPAAAAMGGVPMVPALVDKPGNHGGGHGPRTKLVAQLGNRAAPIRSRRHPSSVAGPLSDSERNELDKLRAIVADLTNQRDKAANSIKEAIAP